MHQFTVRGVPVPMADRKVVTSSQATHLPQKASLNFSLTAQNKKVMAAVTSLSVYSLLLLLCTSFLSLFPVDGLLGRGKWKTGQKISRVLRIIGSKLKVYRQPVEFLNRRYSFRFI